MGLVAVQIVLTLWLAHRVHALETELLGVYMEVVERLGIEGSDRTPRLRNAVQALRTLRGKT